jgi:hypothetical protein
VAGSCEQGSKNEGNFLANFSRRTLFWGVNGQGCNHCFCKSLTGRCNFWPSCENVISLMEKLIKENE